MRRTGNHNSQIVYVSNHDFSVCRLHQEFHYNELFIQPYDNYFRMFQACHNFRLSLPVPDKISKTEMRQCHTASKAIDLSEKPFTHYNNRTSFFT